MSNWCMIREENYIAKTFQASLVFGVVTNGCLQHFKNDTCAFVELMSLRWIYNIFNWFQEVNTFVANEYSYFEITKTSQFEYVTILFMFSCCNYPKV